MTFVVILSIKICGSEEKFAVLHGRTGVNINTVQKRPTAKHSAQFKQDSTRGVWRGAQTRTRTSPQQEPFPRAGPHSCYLIYPPIYHPLLPPLIDPPSGLTSGLKVWIREQILLPALTERTAVPSPKVRPSDRGGTSGGNRPPSPAGPYLRNTLQQPESWFFQQQEPPVGGQGLRGEISQDEMLQLQNFTFFPPSV